MFFYERTTKRQRIEEGIELENPDAYISLREDTVKTVCGFLEKNNIILIRSPPYSGKTSLAILLKNHFKKIKAPNEEIIQVTFLSIGAKAEYKTFEDFWIKNTGKSWDEWLFRKEPTTIIIDEGQNGYPKNFPETINFWNRLKEMCQEDRRELFKHIRVIVFSAYGQQGIGSEFATPFGFPASYGALLLFCNHKEAQELVDDFNKKNEAKIKITPEMSKAIFRLTEGHIGMISLTLGAIEDKFKYMAGLDPSVVDNTQIYRYLNSFEFIAKILSHRAAPSLVNLTKAEHDFLQTLLLNRKASLRTTSQGDLANSLIKKNLIRFVDEDQSKMFATGSSEEVCFISSLVELVCFHKLLGSERPKEVPSSLEDCVLKILSLIKPSFLKNSKGFGTKKRLNERSWQMEFYRVATSVLPQQHHISADLQRINVTETSDGEELGGALDFYINDGLDWAIELLREGDRMEKHSERFTNGNYLKLNPKAYVLLDFRDRKSVV